MTRKNVRITAIIYMYMYYTYGERSYIPWKYPKTLFFHPKMMKEYGAELKFDKKHSILRDTARRNNILP